MALLSCGIEHTEINSFHHGLYDRNCSDYAVEGAHALILPITQNYIPLSHQSNRTAEEWAVGSNIA